VRDSLGRRYEQVSADLEATPADADATEVILTFALPAAPTDNLRLELPAAAWGGTGIFKFAIPPAMGRR
jgi:hypothetical protein